MSLLPDPSILLLIARERKDGTVRVRSMDDLPEGTISPTAGYHDSDIELLDDNGRLLSSRGIGLSFEGILEPMPGSGLRAKIIEHEEASIQAALAYPPETALVRFRKGDRVLLEIDPVPQTLRSSIEIIPDGAFPREPSKRRKALLANVDALGQELSKKEFEDALETLRSLRARVANSLIDFTPDDGFLHTSKSKLLALIDRVDARLQVRMSNFQDDDSDSDDSDDSDDDSDDDSSGNRR